MKVMGLVTAKSYSGRVPRKNFYPLKGIPLYQWTTEYLNKYSDYFASLVMSSDKPDEFDLPYTFIKLYRPKILCEDEMPHIKSVKHAVYSVKSLYDIETDWVILFQPTNPIRQEQELLSMTKIMLRHNESNRPIIIRSYYEDTNVSQSYFPYATWNKDIEGVHVRSGTMYAYNRSYLDGSKNEPLEMRIKVPKWRGYNINDKEDLFITEALMDCHNYKLESVGEL